MKKYSKKGGDSCVKRSPHNTRSPASQEMGFRWSTPAASVPSGQIDPRVERMLLEELEAQACPG